MFKLGANIAGLQLCRMVGEELKLTERVVFTKGAQAVDTVLRRAQIAGKVGPIGPGVELGDYWADLLEADGAIVSHAVLDAASFRSLKRHWLRVRYV